MKNFVLVMAFFAFLSAGAASSYKAYALNTNDSEIVTQDKQNFEKIELSELPAAVKEAVETEDRLAVIESAEQSVLANGDKIYKVTLKSSEMEELTRIYYADGKKYEKEK